MTETRWLSVALNLAGVIAVLAIWQIASQSGVVSSILLPPPSSVLARLIELARQPAFWTDFGATVLLWILSTVAGTALGLLVGLLSYLHRGVWRLIQVPVEFVRSLPSVALVPLVALFAGVGGTAQFASAFIVVAALMIAGCAAVVRNLPIGQERLIHAWRVPGVKALRIFVLPNLLSETLVALRAAVPLALVVLIACDILIATEAGLGRLIRDGLAILDMKTVLAAVLAVGLLGYAGSVAVTMLDRLLISWRRG